LKQSVSGKIDQNIPRSLIMNLSAELKKWQNEKDQNALVNGFNLGVSDAPSPVNNPLMGKPMDSSLVVPK
jgi:hypothetical protein